VSSMRRGSSESNAVKKKVSTQTTAAVMATLAPMTARRDLLARERRLLVLAIGQGLRAEYAGAE
jgi:hypothetical protein